MNIQAMLDRRIETLKQESRDGIMAVPLDLAPASPASAKNDKVATITAPANKEIAARVKSASGNAGAASGSETIDQALSELARRVYDLTEQVGVDLSRWEREMLASKLAILQKAEAALDLALALKQRFNVKGGQMDEVAPVASLDARRGAARSEG